MEDTSAICSTKEAEPVDVLCMATSDSSCNFKPMRFQRRPVGEFDIKIKMQYCGICHTDLHVASGHMGAIGMKSYPCVPGHELAGICVEVGQKVTKIKVGDPVGVGCMVDSCFNCSACKRGDEHKCIKQVGTYAAPSTPRSATYPAGGRTLGGYTNYFVVQEHFAILIPRNIPLQYAGPVMCAGVTLYTPLKDFNATAGTRVAIVGIGGLGSIGIKIAKAKKCIVTAISQNATKEQFARTCGADAFICSSDKAQMAAAAGTFDLVLNTISAEHDEYVYTRLVKSGGKHVMLGINTSFIASMVADGLLCGSSKVGASGIGSIASTQEVIDLCAEHNILPEIDVINVEDINKAYEALDKQNASGLRYVIDIAGSLNEDAFRRCEEVPPPSFTPQQAIVSISCGSICGAICHLLCCCRCWC